MKIRHFFKRAFLAGLVGGMGLFAGAGPAGAQTNAAFQAILAKRAGADSGALPCKYASLPRPSVLVNPARLALVRREALQKGSERQAIFEKYILPEANRWLHREIVIPPTGGWPHDFFCSDGTMLELPADEQFDPTKPSVCPVCGRKYMSAKIIAARHSFEHYWLCQAVRDLALVYAITGKKAYAAKAGEILTRYADAYPTQDIQSLTLMDAVNLIPMAEGYDLIYDALTTAQRDHITRDFFWPAAQALTKAGFHGNWGSWHLSAIGVIGYATRHQRFIDFATREFKAQISEQLGDDGLWPESVSTYHFYPLDGFLAFVEAAANCGDDLYGWEAKPGKGIRAMFTAPLRYAYPNLRLAAINDGWYDAYLPQDQYTMAYYRYRLPEFGWAVQAIQKGGKSGVPGDFLDQHYRDLLYGEPMPASFPRPVFRSLDFPVLGIAILRQGSALPASREMMMTFDYGPLLGHGQPDKMGVTLFAGGKIRAADYGTTGYASALDRFLRSTAAHNTIVVDGRDQPATKDRDLVAFVDTTDFRLAAARTTQVAQGAEWTRTVMLTDQYAVVWDHITGTQSHRYDWFLHAEGKRFALRSGAERAEDFVPADTFGYRFIDSVRQVGMKAGTGAATWQGADGRLRAWFYQPGTGQVVYRAAMPTGGTATVPLLVLRQTGKAADFLAVLRYEGKDTEAADGAVRVEQDGRGLGVRVVCGKRTDHLTLGPDRVVYRRPGKTPLVTMLPPERRQSR